MQSLAHQFLTFCRSKPADEAYNFESIGNCAFCQFLGAAGLARNPSVEYLVWCDGEQEHELPLALRGAGEGSMFAGELGVSVIGAKPWTFGALADRLETLLASK